MNKIAQKDSLFVEELKSPWESPIHFFETVTSTNDIAMEMASQGALEGTIVIGEEQTRGRGKFHRPWSSPKGLGLFLSLILHLPINDTTIPLLSQLGPVALCDAITTVSALASLLQIKEPNDLLLHAKKVAGVLVETRSSFAVVGIGLNVHQQEKDFPSEITYPVTSLNLESSHFITRQEIAVALIESLYKRSQELLHESQKLGAAWKMWLRN